MSTKWAKCSAPDSVGRQANSRAALPSFFSFSVGLHSNTPPAFGALTCPGRTFLRPFRNHAAASAVRALGSRSSNSPSSFKAKPATARALLFSCPCLRVCADAPVQFVAQAAQYISLFSPLPPCVAHLPAVQRDVSQKSRPIIPKNAELSGKTRGAFPAYSTVSRLCRHRRSAHARVFTELPDARKHRVPILCINSAAFSLFPSVCKIWAGILHSHFYILSRQFHNKAFSTPNLSQRSRNSKSRIPTCSDCPRTIMYLISHFKNFSL